MGFYVEDAKAYAQHHHELYGSGPFVVMENIPAEMIFRGKEVTFDLTFYTGWWRNLSVEIIQQNDDQPSFLSENGRYGFHHIAIGVSDVQKACKEFEAAGNSVQIYNFTIPQFKFAYIDARNTCGYYVELNPEMDFMSQVVRGWAEDWDGKSDLFRNPDGSPR